jgi:DNA-binding transcriptional LysR family regulator
MNLNDLRYVVAVDKIKNISRAAMELDITQSAISHSLSRLEDEFETILFIRSSKNMEPTESGRVFIAAAKKIVEQCDSLASVMRSQTKHREDHLAIGISLLDERFFVPAITELYDKQYPNINIEFIRGTVWELESRVLNGQLDFCIITAPITSRDIENIPLIDEEMLIVVPESLSSSISFLANEPFSYVDLFLLRDESFIISGRDNFFAQSCYDICSSSGFIPTKTIDTNTFDNIVAFASRGMGVGFVPISLASRENGRDDSVCYCRMKGTPFFRKLYLSYNSSRRTRPAGFSYIKTVTELFSPQMTGLYPSKASQYLK